MLWYDQMGKTHLCAISDLRLKEKSITCAIGRGSLKNEGVPKTEIEKDSSLGDLSRPVGVFRHITVSGVNLDILRSSVIFGLGTLRVVRLIRIAGHLFGLVCDSTLPLLNE